MAIQFHQWEGGTTGTPQAISAFAGNQITCGSITGDVVGDILVAAGTTSNDGWYTLTNRVSNTVKQVVPTPNAEAAAGTLVRMKRATAKQAAVAVTNFVAGNVIQAAGALFITNNVQVNDRVIVTLDPLGAQSAGGNNGAWFVVSVDSETQITVRGLNGEAGIVAAAGGGAQVAVRQGSVRVNLVSEGTPRTLTSVQSTGIPMPQQAPGASDFAAGVIGDYLIRDTNFSPNRQLWFVQGILALSNESTDFDFDLHNDIVIVRNIGKGEGNGTHLAFRWEYGAPQLNLGHFDGGDRYAASEGSVLIGADCSVAQGGFNAVGSYIDTIDAKFSIPTTSFSSYSLASTILRPSMFAATLTPPFISSLIESSIIYGDDAAASQGIHTLQAQGTTDWKNVNLGKVLAPQFFVGGGGDVYMEGLLKSTRTPNKLFGAFNATFHVLNPRGDYDLPTEIVTSVFGSGTEVRKAYTWNPRFVSRAPGVIATPAPIEGLTIQVWEINETTSAEVELPGSPYTTAASGRIEGVEADRDGINLRRQSQTAAATTGFSHRIRIEGVDVNTKQAYRAVNQVITMISEFLADVAVDVLCPDYEGEMSRG